MKKLIEPAKFEIAEYCCDSCKQLVLIDGLPEDQVPETNRNFSVALSYNCGILSNTPGLVGNLDLCESCGDKVIKAVESVLNIKIESNLFKEI